MERDSGEGWDKERRKVKKKDDFLEKMKRTQIGTQNLSSCLSSLKFDLSSFKKLKKYAIILKV